MLLKCYERREIFRENVMHYRELYNEAILNRRILNISVKRKANGDLYDRPCKLIHKYVEIKCQLDATDDIYRRFYCLLNMFRAPLCPSSRAREYYADGRCLWYLVLWFSSCRYGVELRVMCPVCRLLARNMLSKQ